jgi:hypothetical protein
MGKVCAAIFLFFMTAGTPGAAQQDTIKQQPDSIGIDDLKGFEVSSEDEYRIQVGAFREKDNAESLYRRIKAFMDMEARIVIEDGLYKVRITSYPGKQEPKVPEVQDAATGEADTISAGVIQPDSLDASIMTSDTTMTDAAASGAEVLSDEIKGAAGKILFLSGDSPWLTRIRYFGKSFTLVNALIITIIFSISSMIFLLVFILANRSRIERREKLHQFLLEKYQGLIIDFLFGNTGIEPFRQIASDNYRRQVLIDQMIDVSANLKGDESKKLLELYKALGLDRDSVKRAFDIRWHKKIKGFRELAFMGIRDGNAAMYKALNSSNELLRMEAQIALVSLGDEDPFEFLSHLKRPFSMWEQITLHDMIIQHDMPRPAFRKWLFSYNSTVVLFALRMIREFSQSDAEKDVVRTLSHPSPKVRQLAVQVAGDMSFRSALEVMKRMYKKEGYNICLEIVKSMGRMPDLSMMGFLKLVLDKEDDVQLQIAASKAIQSMGEEGIEALNKLMSSEYKNYSIIIKHVLDKRIM